MIMTDYGFAAIESSSHGPLYRVMSWLGLVTRQEPIARFEPMVASPETVSPPRAPRPGYDPVRVAESYAFNALVAARNGGYAKAESYFREAFTLDRSMSPARLTNFWQLPHQAHEAANRALIAAGREDDAVALTREMLDRAARAQVELHRAAS
jgi:hypothetical protein